jgi:glutamate racemase
MDLPATRLDNRAPDVRPVGVFDSGVGGLSVTRELMRRCPAQPMVYLADQLHTPYGDRSLTEIRDLADGITRFLLAEGAALIVVACNTASAAALHWLRGRYPGVPFVGMEPAVKPAAERTRSGQVGVIATSATFQGELFASLLDRYAAQVTVHTQACPQLVPLIEAGELNSRQTREAVERYLAPLLAAGIDELVLGCTHYPFLRSLIQEVSGPGVEIIDPAPAVAQQAIRVLARRGWDATGDAPPMHRFYTTGDPAHFKVAVQALLDRPDPVFQAVWSGEGLLARRYSK